MGVHSNLAIHRREQMESPHPARQLLTPRLALLAHQADTVALAVTHGTAYSFTIDWARDAGMSLGQFFALLQSESTKGDVRLRVECENDQITGLVIGVRPRRPSLDVVRECEGADLLDDDAHAIAELVGGA